jgi:WD40 repeat protein
MALADLRVAREHEGWPAGTMAGAFDASFQRYARSDGRGNISVRREADDEELVRLPGPGTHAWHMQFSPDGQFLAAIYHQHSEIRVWNVSKGAVLLRLLPTGGVFDFSPDSRRLAVSQSEGSPLLYLYDLPSGNEAGRLTKLPRSGAIKFHPEGRKLAIAVARPPSGNDVLIWDQDAAKVVLTLAHPGVVRGLAWHPDGKLLAVSSGFLIHVWDTVTGRRLRVLEGHEAEAASLTFNQGGHLLASTGWDDTLRLWDPLGGKHLVSTPGARTGLALQFSADDRLLAGTKDGSKVKVWEVADGRACRTLYSYSEPGKGATHLDYSPAGRLLASGHADGVRFWDSSGAQEVAHLPLPSVTEALFEPTGRSLLTTSQRTVLRWPVGPTGPGQPTGLRIGPPQVVLELPPANGDVRIALQPDGRRMAVSNRDSGEVIVVDLAEPEKRVVLPGQADLKHVAISPDGRWVASGTSFHFPRDLVRVAEVPSKKVVWEQPTTLASVAFHPDGKGLATGGDQCRLWEVGSWRLDKVLFQDESLGDAGAMAFSRDGKVLAVAYSSRLVRLVEPSSGLELATLNAPHPLGIAWLGFSPDGTHLAAACSNHQIQVWDLALIRRQLAEISLDWDAPSYPLVRAPARNGPQSPALKVEIVGADQVAGAADRYREAVRLNNQAWKLATDPASKWGPAQALPSAEQAVKLEPENATFLNTLGLVLYRNERYREAVPVLEKSLAMRQGQHDGFDLFFLAMCHARLGDAVKARKCYGEAVQWR